MRIDDKVVRRVLQLYNRAIVKAVARGVLAPFDPEKPYSFEDFPDINKKVDAILRSLHDGIVEAIAYGTEESWKASNIINDALVKRLFPTAKIDSRAFERIMEPNLAALDRFQKRKEAGMDLSTRVWNLTKQFKTELELGLDVALIEGKSANETAKDIKQYLKEPNRLFRRVRDARGNLQLSKAAKAYHPGQGVYRSSFKNAQRLARTEINMAYKEADFKRWDNFDFVVGYEIKRSNRKTPCDICENLKGVYPKSFKFRGWHPNCLCVCLPILATPDELDELLEHIEDAEWLNKFKSVNTVERMPKEYTKFVEKESKTLLRAKSTPFWIKDNYKDGNLKKGLKFEG